MFGWYFPAPRQLAFRSTYLAQFRVLFAVSEQRILNERFLTDFSTTGLACAVRTGTEALKSTVDAVQS
jgi:hypothetical protein